MLPDVVVHPVVPEARRLKQEDGDFEASFELYSESLSQKKKKK
jgi:hypothetical protein